MAEPLQFVNSDTPEDDRPPLLRRGLTAVLASAPGPTERPDWSPALPGRQKVARDSELEVSEDDGDERGSSVPCRTRQLPAHPRALGRWRHSGDTISRSRHISPRPQLEVGTEPPIWCRKAGEAGGKR
jgi:hypothetical protein